jgi:hypothetical protein
MTGLAINRRNNQDKLGAGAKKGMDGSSSGRVRSRGGFFLLGVLHLIF